MKKRDGINEARARKVISGSGYECTELVRILPPDKDGMEEGLFRGRFKGLSRGALKIEEEVQLYTCHIWPDGTGFVTQGW